MRSISLGVFLGVVSVLLFKPQYVVNRALQYKIETLEELIIDHELEINNMKKRLERGTK